jgi:1-acyl-sn-glycerol-3-phosphate acyltransferase
VRPRAPEKGTIRRLLYAPLWLLMNGLFRVYFRMRVRGRPRPFPRGPLVVAANHCSYLDPLLLGLALPRRVVFLVTSSVYYRRFYRPWMWFFRAIPVQDDSVNVDAMRRALAVLAAGGVVGIFPEGGIGGDGRLREGQIGVASLLLLGGAPVLTAGLVGTHEAMPRERKLPRPVRLEVRFSEVVRPEAVDAGRSHRDARRVLRDRVMASIERVLPERMRRAGAG